MKMLAKIVSENKVDVALGNDTNYYIKKGFKELNVEQGTDGQWYLSEKIPNELKVKEETEIDKKLKELEQIENETGYNRLTRDLYFSLKKLGGSINQTVYKKMLEIETLAKKYRKQLKNEQSKTNGDLED